MTQPLALPTFREQDFLAPQSRTVGAGVEGLEEITDLERSERLRRMREGTLGSIHSWELVTAVDGPGTRMMVFLNGCPLRCLYCHNPDTFLMKDGAPVSDTELLSRIARYRRIFRTTKGGITLSGGEVLMQPQFAKRILMGAKEMGVHTCIDTSGFLGANCDDEMLDAIDLVLLDVKSGNEETYKKATGRSLAPTIEFGDRIAVGLDVKLLDGQWRLRGRGWVSDGGDLWEVLARLDRDGCSRYVVTDVTKDGTLSGPNLDLLREVCAATESPVVASGGVSTVDDLRAIATLVDEGVEGAIIGKALYAGRFTLTEALDAVSR